MNLNYLCAPLYKVLFQLPSEHLDEKNNVTSLPKY